MVTNERGSTLIIVLLMMLVFTVLGLSIMSASIGGTKRTELRETDIEDNLAAIKHLNEAVAYIRATVDTYKPTTMTFTEYEGIMKTIADYDISNEKCTITDSTPVKAKENQSLTRQFEVKCEVTSTNEQQTVSSYKQNVYITGMPSFLKYALGSRGHLTLNGSVYIQDGNLYAKEGLTVSNTANYIYMGVPKTKKTELPSFSLDSAKQYLFLEKDNITFYENSASQLLTKNEFNKAFNPHYPIFTKEDSEFIEVDIPKTFLEKLQEAGFNTTQLSRDAIAGGVTKEVKTIQKITNKPTLVYAEDGITLLESIKNIENDEKELSYFYNGNASIDTNDLDVNKDRWLIINGDATFESIGAEKMKINANILVTGDVYMRDQLAFNSTMYVLGNTFIDDTKIQDLDGGQLILMTQGNLDISKVNVTKEGQPDATTFIKAYLYTAQKASGAIDKSTVYAVGSRIHIQGGLFADEDLEINAFRGITTQDDSKDDLIFQESNEVKDSRFIAKYNNKIFSQETSGLPKVKKLEVITDLMEEN